MSFVPRNRSGKIVLVILCLILFFLLIHQHNVAKRFAVSGDLSESLQLIFPCIPPNPEVTVNSSSPAHPGIPDVIHQVWKTADVRTYTTLPFEPSHNAWKSMFLPVNYTVKLWTDDDVLHLVKTQYPWLLSTYEGYPQNIQRADLARLAIVHSEGGIYADLDVYPQNTTVMRCLQDLHLQNIFAPTSGSGLSNHFFMAERGSPLLLLALYEAKRRGGPEARQFLLLPYLKVFWTTGPLMVTAAFREYAWLYAGQKSVGLLDPRYMRTVIGHAAGRSWHGSDGMVLNYMADHVWRTLLMVAFALTVLVGGMYAVRICLGRYRGRFVHRRVNGVVAR